MRITVREALAAIEDSEGRLTPDAVVETARNPDHPLHNHFDWDDAVAAHAHRVATARRLIASVQVRVRHHRVILSAPAYVRDPDAATHSQGYRAVQRMRDDTAEARVVVINEMSRVRSILRRTRALCVALGRESDLDVLEGEVERFVSGLAESEALAPHASS